MRRVAGFVVVVVAVLSSPVVFASSDAVADLQTSIHALANAKTATATTVDRAHGIDVGFSGVNVMRDAKTGNATTSAEQNVAPAATAGVHH